MQLTVTVSITIQKSVNEVFEAIVNPAHMSGYFIAESTGKLEEGKTVTWKFPEFDFTFPVFVEKVETNNCIIFLWEDAGQQTKVTILLSKREPDCTFIKITEGEKQADEAGIKWLQGNTEGWANFLACLKAYLEYGINLRKGAFDEMKTKTVA